MPEETSQRTHVRVIRDVNGERREFANMFVAYRELLGTSSELGYSEHQRMRALIRRTGVAVDRHGFTWRSLGGTVAEETIRWTDFTFGCELELLAPFPQFDMARMLQGLPEAHDFRVVHDGSLTAAPGMWAMEVVTCILKGTEGLERLTKVVRWLKEKGCKINSSCGFHVHIGVRGMKPERVRRIAVAFLNAEQHFDSVVPPSRRHGNRYCRSNSELAGASARRRLGNATTISSIAESMNGGNSHDHYTPFRYYKLNFQSFVRHGTIEFRQHAGTVEVEKACAWVRLVAGFCARAAGQPEQSIGTNEPFETWLDACTDEAGQAYMRQRRVKFSATGVRREYA